MESKILIPLSDRIEDINILNEDDDVFREKVNATIRFGKQPINLGQFIPCDEDGNVLEEPNWTFGENNILFLDQKIWREAQDRVIFKGLTIEKCTSKLDGEEFLGVTLNGTWCGGWDYFLITRVKGKDSTLEDLTHLNLELTDNALNR